MELYKPEDISTLCLGVQGENKSRIIQIDVSDWLKEFPNANINILVTRPTETTPYIANTSVINGIFTWLISDSDTTYSGLGKAELRATQDDIIKKSLTYLTSIKESLEGVPSPLPPEPSESWVNAVIEKANEVLNSRVESFNINEQGHLIATLEDGTTQDLGSVVGGVSSVNGQTGNVVLNAEDVGALPNDTVIPSKTSDLTNDSGFITDVDLTGYATETWVNAQIAAIPIQGLINAALTNYYTKAEVNTALENKENISNKVTSLSASSTDTQYPSAKCVYDGLANKVDKEAGKGLFSGSYTDLTNKPTIPTVDQTYDGTSANAQSGVAVASAIASKEDISNKVASISAQSTDTQYPTAKCVYDIVGDIESLLSALR